MAIKIDDILQHELYLQRLATGGVRSVVYPMLDSIFVEIKAILDRQGVIASPQTLAAITSQVNQAILANNGWATLTNENLMALAEYEAGWQATYAAAGLDAPIKTPAVAQIQSFVSQAIMSLSVGGRATAGVWGAFVAENKNSQSRLINGIITTGYARGEDIRTITKNIRTATDGIMRREAEALARTGYIHYANAANDAMVDANRDLLDEWYYVITFDNRTSDTCIALDKFNAEGSRFSIEDSGAPTPPLHYNCRTRRIGVPKKYEPTGTRAAVGGQKGKDAQEAFEEKKDRLRTASQVRYKGRKDSEIFKAGQIKANTSYEKWLKAQPRWFVEDTLGVSKAKLFLNGELPLARFSDMTGRPLTLAQLRDRYSGAFNKAGLGGG